MGAQDILVQRILRHAKAHVTRDHYIKVFDDTVIAAMERLQVEFEAIEEADQNNTRQPEFTFGDSPEQQIGGSQRPTRGGFSELLGG